MTFSPRRARLRIALAAAFAGVACVAGAFELEIPAESEAPKPVGRGLSESLENGGFEESAEQGAAPPAWERFGSPGGPEANVAVTLDESRDGRASLRLAGEIGGATTSGVRQSVAVRAGDWVRLEAWALLPTSDPLAPDGRYASMSVEFRAGPDSPKLPGSNAKRLADGGTPPDAWARQRLVVRVPDGGALAEVSLLLTQPSAGLGSVRVDDVSLTVIPAPIAGQLPGDFNRDGRVDAADFTVWRDASSGLMPPEYTAKADANGDGVVDEADRQVWSDHVGLTAEPED